MRARGQEPGVVGTDQFYDTTAFIRHRKSFVAPDDRSPYHGRLPLLSSFLACLAPPHIPSPPLVLYPRPLATYP